MLVEFIDMKHELILLAPKTDWKYNVPRQPVLATFCSDPANGFQVAKRYASLTGYYKFTPVQNDSMLIFVAMYKNGKAIGSGAINPNPVGRYRRLPLISNTEQATYPVYAIFSSLILIAGGRITFTRVR